MYQLPSATQQPISNLQLNSAVMMDIFSGKITTWNYPEIAALNPGVALPNHPIVVVIRSDASGDNYIFSQYLDTLEPAAWTAFASAVGFSPDNSATALWPRADRRRTCWLPRSGQLRRAERLGQRLELRGCAALLDHLRRDGLRHLAQPAMRRGAERLGHLRHAVLDDEAIALTHDASSRTSSRT